MLSTLFVVVLGLLVGASLVKGGGLSFPWAQFYIRGKESGFRIQEIHILHKLVNTTSIRDPLSIFWSTKSLLKCIAVIEKEYREKKIIDQPASAHFLRKLYSFINRTENKKRTRRKGLRTTHEIPTRQEMEMSLGKSQSKKEKDTTILIEQQPRYIAVARPSSVSSQDIQKYVDNKQEVQLSFFYKHDALYSFPARILTDYTKNNIDVLHITHSRKLTRHHLRKEVRQSLNVKGELFLIGPHSSQEEQSEVYRESGGFQCQIVDISESGLAIIAKGSIHKDQSLRVQFIYHKTPIVYSAKVIGVQMDSSGELLLVRLKASLPSVSMQNRISSIVYGISDITARERRIIPSNRERQHSISRNIDNPSSRRFSTSSPPLRNHNSSKRPHP